MERLGEFLPWVAVQGIFTRWLRHTTLTWIKCHFGYAVAGACVGHNDSGSQAGTTATYVRATIHEVAADAICRVDRGILHIAAWRPTE